MDTRTFAALLGTAVTPATADRTLLTRERAICWPGAEDRTIPIARGWLRHTGPRWMAVQAHVCPPGGHCPRCN